MAVRRHPELAPTPLRPDDAMVRVAQDLRRLLVGLVVVAFAAGVASGLAYSRLVPMLEVTTANTATLRQQVIDVRHEVGTMRQELQAVHGDMNTLQAQVGETTGHVRHMDQVIRRLEQGVLGLIGKGK